MHLRDANYRDYETNPKPIYMVEEQPPLELCGIRHPLYNAEGGARICSWIHIVSSLIAFCCAGILCYNGAGISWSLCAGLVFLLTGLSGLVACMYRLTLTILISMITCLVSAAFSLIMIVWAVFCLATFIENNYASDYTLDVDNDIDDVALKIVLSVQILLGICGVAELVTDIIHAVKAIRIICCFRDESRYKRQGSKIVTTPSLRTNNKRPMSLVIENLNVDEKSSVFV